MPETMLVSKIECNSPNSRKSRVHNRNYLIYIATRDGVDLTNTDLEKELNVLNPSDSSDNETYLKYIHERPGSNGLFGNIDVSDSTALGNHLADLTANGHLIYRGFVSLYEKDAIKLGFDNKKSWEDYMRQTLPDIAREFKIPIDKLQWTAAYHIKNGHPHCHFMFWSTERQVRSPFIHPSVNSRCRELFSKEMFHLEREQNVIDKTAYRDCLYNLTKDFAADQINFLFKEEKKLTGFFKTSDVKEFSKEILKFTSTLPEHGRLQYAFLPPDTKAALDAIVDKLLKIQPLSTEYHGYMHAMENISDTYSASDRHKEVTLDQADKELRKRLANAILNNGCKKLLHQKDLLSRYQPQDTDIDISLAAKTIEPEQDTFLVFEDETEFVSSEPGSPEHKYILSWNSRYKTACRILSDPDIEDKTQAIQLLRAELKRHNVLAYQKLADLYAKGTFITQDIQKAETLYQETFHGYQYCLKHPEPHYDLSYIHYRLGRHYEYGFGTAQSDTTAINHYKQGIENKYAKYALGNMYLHEKGIDVTPDNKEYWTTETATLFKLSADEDMPYAAYAYAKLCESNPVIIKESPQTIDSYYSAALNGFEKSVQKNPDDNLYYRLGTMYYDGKGTSSNQDKAYDYFVLSAKYNNANAQYALGKTFADSETKYYDLHKAEEMFLLSHEQKNVYATLALGKLYANPSKLFNPAKAYKYYASVVNDFPEQANYALGKLLSDQNSSLYNLPSAVQHFSLAANLGNTNAQYHLAQIMLTPESKFYNFQQAFDLLHQSSESENTYAMAKLGSLYLWGHKELKSDETLGRLWLNKAIENGNEFAKETLAMYENYHNDISISLTFGLCRHLLSICSSRRQPDNLNEIASKVRSKEAVIDRQQKDDRIR